MKSILCLVLFLGLPCAEGLALRYSGALRFAEISLARCLEIPESCANGVDQMRKTASTIKEEVNEELNATRVRLHSISLDFDRCNTLTSQVSSYTSEVTAKAESHRLCRVHQKADFDASMSCKKLLTAVKANRTVLCERNSLTNSPNDLVSLCTPTHQEGLGMWLGDMVETFSARYTQWKKDHDACQIAGTMVAPQEASCSVLEHALNQREQECGEALDRIESFSCSWATGFAAQCSAYDTCYTSVLSRHSDAVREANESIVRWRKSWLAATRMECMANAMNTSGSVDETKMHVCNGHNITNMSFIKVVIRQPPIKVACPAPEIYPGSTLYHNLIYSNLKEGIQVRQPTPCRWSEPVEACESWATAHEGYCYGVIDQTPFSDMGEACQSGSYKLPEGYSLVPFSQDIQNHVASRFKFGTWRVVYSNGETWATGDSGSCGRCNCGNCNINNNLVTEGDRFAVRTCHQWSRVFVRRATRRVGDTPCTFYTYSVESFTGLLDNIAAPTEGASTQQGDISSLRLSGAPGCTSTFYCNHDCKSNTHFDGASRCSRTSSFSPLVRMGKT